MFKQLHTFLINLLNLLILLYTIVITVKYEKKIKYCFNYKLTLLTNLQTLQIFLVRRDLQRVILKLRYFGDFADAMITGN